MQASLARRIAFLDPLSCYNPLPGKASSKGQDVKINAIHPSTRKNPLSDPISKHES